MAETPEVTDEKLIAVDQAAKARIRVLVVDSDRTLRESVVKFLEIEGYNVTVARQGEEALHLLRQRNFHILLLELYMSGVPGMDLFRAALEKNPETIVIVMTGHPSVQSSIDVLRAGAWDYLPKPFTATQLQVLVGRAAHTVIVGRLPDDEAPENRQSRCPTCGTLIRKKRGLLWRFSRAFRRSSGSSASRFWCSS